MKKKELILRLIKDHLINTRLVSGLQKLGLQGDYCIHAGDTVFNLLGIADEEDLYEEFLKWTEGAVSTDIWEYPKYLDNASRSIYKLLKQEIKYLENAKRRKDYKKH